MQLNPEDLDQGSFAQLLAGGQQPAQEVAPAGGGIGELISGARSSLQANPAIANALMQTFATMARSGGANFGDALGKGVAQGAQTFMMHGAQQKDDAEKQAQIQRQTAEKDRAYALDKTKTEASVEASKASTAVNTEKLRQDRDLFASRKAKIEQDIALVQEKLAQAPNERARIALGIKLDKLKIAAADYELQLDKRFGHLDRESTIAVKGQQLSNLQEQGVGQVIDNDIALQTRDARATMTPEQLAVLGKGGTGVASTVNKELSDSQLYVAFEKNYADTLPIGAKPDPAAKQAAWSQFYMNARRAPTPGAPAAGGTAPADTAAWEAARAKVKVGQAYIGPDGKTYKRNQ